MKTYQLLDIMYEVALQYRKDFTDEEKNIIEDFDYHLYMRILEERKKRNAVCAERRYSDMLRLWWS